MAYKRKSKIVIPDSLKVPQSIVLRGQLQTEVEQLVTWTQLVFGGTRVTAYRRVLHDILRVSDALRKIHLKEVKRRG